MTAKYQSDRLNRYIELADKYMQSDDPGSCRWLYDLQLQAKRELTQENYQALVSACGGEVTRVGL